MNAEEFINSPFSLIVNSHAFRICEGLGVKKTMRVYAQFA